MRLSLDAINLLHRAAAMLALASESSRSKECLFCEVRLDHKAPCPWMEWCKDFEALQQRERQETGEL